MSCCFAARRICNRRPGIAIDPANGKATKTALFRTSPADFSDYEVTRDFAVSKDGTKVPLNIIHKKGLKLNGDNPTILYGYGGYGVSLSPNFRVGRKVWLEQGGIYVLANLRGGGEYGEAWHHGRQPDQQAKCLRRFHRLCQLSDRAQVHQSAEAGH